jgi:hypothetical protein
MYSINQKYGQEKCAHFHISIVLTNILYTIVIHIMLNHKTT